MRKLLLLVITSLFCMVVLHIQGANVFMIDGQVYRGATELDSVNVFYVFKVGIRNYSVNKNRIKKITDRYGNLIYEKLDLTVEILKRENGNDFYKFYKNRDEIGEGGWASNGEFDITSGDVTDGTYKQYYDAGKLHRTFEFKNSKLNGWSKVYFKSGKVEREGFFKDNKEAGTSKIFFDAGVLKGTSIYFDGEKNGITTLYYKSGNIKARMNFIGNVPDGLQKMYYDSGALETEVYFKKGVKDGPIKQYYESGKIKMLGHLENGKLNGNIVTYYESGRIKKKVYFQKGRVFKDR